MLIIAQVLREKIVWKWRLLLIHKQQTNLWMKLPTISPRLAGKPALGTNQIAGFSLRSKRFRSSSSRKVGTRAKKKKWRGRGKGKREVALDRKPQDFEKLCSPTNAASDWCGAGSVGYLALETSIKLGMLCLRAPQIWSYLICGRRLQLLWTDIYLNLVCAKVYHVRSESLKYNVRSSSGD